ncbi:hypothetical protein TWF718_001048 [Orbilia javanica]|uniref:Uncharacterized protein n=1 Tax=Orbilia javanica TaxID=47235 RepID=A0AAN8N068_9PEZI
MAGVVLLELLDWRLVGHGRFFPADDNLQTQDFTLSSPEMGYLALAVYPEYAFEAILTIDSPLLEKLVNPGYVGTYMIHLDWLFHQIVRTTRQKFRDSRAEAYYRS